MIRSIRSKALSKALAHDDWSGVKACHILKLKSVLPRLSKAASLGDISGMYGFHKYEVCRSAKAKRYALWVDARWRLLFRFRDGGIEDLEYVNYH